MKWVIDCDFSVCFQNPNEDTEWNDVLRQKGIIPQKEKGITEDDIIQMMEQTIEDKQKSSNEFLAQQNVFNQNVNIDSWIFLGEKELSELDLDGLDELEDSEDEAVLLEYRNRRIAEMRAMAEKSKFGFVREISGQDYVEEVNKAGEGIYVVLHL